MQPVSLQISHVYEQWIALEEKRQANPYRDESYQEEVYKYAHRIDGRVGTVRAPETHYRLVSDFPHEEYIAQQGKLLQELKNLNFSQFMTGSDETSQTIQKLHEKAVKLFQANKAEYEETKNALEQWSKLKI